MNKQQEHTFHLNYGLIGNCQISALISNTGSLDWLCLPRLDSASVFARILDDQKGGAFQIEAEHQSTAITQSYLSNTNVLETLIETEHYAFKILDFIPRYREAGLLHRPIEVHRQIIPLRGTPSIRLIFDPQFDYAREQPQLGRSERSIVARGSQQSLYLQTNLSLETILEQGTHLLQKPAYCVLTYEFPLKEELKAYSRRALEGTILYWQTWVRHCAIPPKYQIEVIRSALTLKLHLFEDTGATIAATTTSVPEIHGSERCWDYRFCWIRDSYFLIDVFSGLAHFEEMEKFILFLKNLCRNGIENLQPLYSIVGEANLHEHVYTHLQGAADSGIVRVGNAAYTHKQYDIYGEMLLSIYPLFFDRRLTYDKHHDLNEEWHLAQQLVEAALAVKDKTDSGIWEFRNEFRHHTFSKLMIWVALDRGAKIASVMKEPATQKRWQEAAQALRAEIFDKAWSDEEQMFAMSYGGADADAAVLLMPVMGLIDAHDPRFVATVKAYKQRLMKNGHVFRYIAKDDFGLPECAFNFCTFWMIHALYLTGEEDEAKLLFENMLKAGNHLGLFSEDTQPETGKMYGNFPQTYTHVGIIQTAKLLSGNRSTYALDYC